MLSKTPHRKGPRPQRPPSFPRRGDAAPARPGAGAAALPAGGDIVPPDAIVALVTGAALVLALATAWVMIKDSYSQPQAVAEAPVVAEPSPAPARPEAVEPRFPAEPPQPQPQSQPQPLLQTQPQAPVQRDDRSEVPSPSEPAEPEGETLAKVQPLGPSAGPKSFPAPVAPSVELLGPAPRKAAAPKVQQASPDMRFAVYLASFSSDEQALAGWQILQRRYQRPLAGLTPLVRRGKSKQGGSVFRLFAGPFELLEAAAQRCGVLSTATANCKPADLSQQAAEGAQSWD